MRLVRLAAVAACAVAFPGLAPAAQPYKADVEKVDAGAGRVTLKHGAIKKLDMEAMTMGYKVADPALLNGIKAGDHVTFDAKGSGEDVTVTKIEKAK